MKLRLHKRRRDQQTLRGLRLARLKTKIRGIIFDHVVKTTVANFAAVRDHYL
jgi:hypothetical protein